MDGSLWVQAIATIIFGSLAGGVTNAVAIWMLFNPHEPRGIWRFKIQGAVPKNKPRLASSIGKIVGERLLTSEDLHSRLMASKTREAFDRALTNYIDKFLHSEFGSARAMLPEAVRSDAEHLLADVGRAVSGKLADFAKTPEFHAAVERIIEKAKQDVGDRPVAEVLTVARRETLRELLGQWVSDTAASTELERAVQDFVNRQMQRFAEDQTPLVDRLPEGLMRALERAVADYLPVALEHVGHALTDPTTRDRMVKTIRQVFDNSVRDLLLHERLVAKMMVTERTIERLLTSLEGEGAKRLGNLLEDIEVREQVAKAINEAVQHFLHTPLADRIAALGVERREGLQLAAADYILSAARDEGTQTRLINALDHALEATEGKTWGDILARLPADDAARWLSDLLTAERVQDWITEATDSLIQTLLDKPIGRPIDVLPDGAAPRVTNVLSGALWEWIQTQIPAVVAQLGVREMVEEKVAGFSIQRMEDLVKRVTDKELLLIVRLGYLLGAFVGAMAFGVNVLLR